MEIEVEVQAPTSDAALNDAPINKIKTRLVALAVPIAAAAIVKFGLLLTRELVSINE